MHLKGLELQGFKSFPDKILIEFENGITAIVGPNGSGKSNIADAVRWVLGEMSSKTLRGSKMEDVIFDGTDNRRSMGYAQVSLIIDNSDSTLPLEFNEVTITRRYYRSGESEYYINKAPCRLKDVNELFMDTGLGRDGYSIIGQGKIAEILSAKSDDRRQIFEEAAGISKYRYKKAEAERKLATTEDNLLRITDIVNELAIRVEPLRIQSKKAKEYLDFMNEKKQFEIDVWLYNIEKSKSLLEKVTVSSNSSKEELFKANADLILIENQIDSSFDATKNFTIEIDNKRQEIAKINEDIANSTSEFAVLTNDIRHNNETVAMIEKQLSNQEDVFLNIDNKINTQNETIDNLKTKENEYNTALNTTISDKLQIESAHTEHLEKLNEINQNIIATTSKITDIKIKQSSTQSSKESISSQRASLDKDNNSILLQYQTSQSEKEKCDKDIKDNENAILAIDNVINGYNLKLESKTKSIENLKSDAEQLEKRIYSSTNRLEMLLDMEKQYQGFGDGVKFVMKKATNHELLGIVGTVSSQIKVPNDYTLAIETALGGGISNIIVETDKDAKAAISHLKSQRIGRATFLPITTIKSNTISKKDIENQHGFIGIASELITADSKLTNIIAFLLGRTIIADHMDSATAIAKSVNYKFKVVTLDGQIVNAGGSMTGGANVRSAGILSRANEITKLKETLNKLNAENTDLISKITPMENDIAKIKAQIDISISEKRMLDEDKIKFHTSHSHFEILLKNLKFTLDNTEVQKKNLKKQFEDILSLENEQVKEYDLLNLGLIALENDAKELSTSSTNFTTSKDRINDRINNIQLSIMGVKKDIEANENILFSFLEQKKTEKQSTSQKKEEISLLNAKSATIKLKLESNNKFSTTSTLLISEKTKEIENCIAKRDENEAHITKLRTDEKSLNEHKENLMLENERLTNKLSSLTNQYDNYISNLFDEYELTLSDAMVLKSENIDITSATKRITKIKSAIKKLGNINVDSIEEYKEVSERYTFLAAQLEDLNHAKNDLMKIITNLTSSMQSIFADQFKIININFARTFTELFDGGNAELILVDPTDILSSGIDIKVAPPGKIIKNLSALSGGEQAFVAIALYFAILKVRPTPFCILDEIEAALDDVNVVKFAEYLRKLTDKTQFISITHRRGTMEEADRLYGVTMQEKGISKMLTININETVNQIKI